MIIDFTSCNTPPRCGWLWTGGWEVCSSWISCRRWQEGHPFRSWNLPRSVSMWPVPVCQIAWQRSLWFKVFLFDRGCNRMSSALHVMNEGVDSPFISIWLSVLVRVSFFITLFWFIRFCRSPRLCWSMARFGTFYKKIVQMVIHLLYVKWRWSLCWRTLSLNTTSAILLESRHDPNIESSMAPLSPIKTPIWSLTAGPQRRQTDSEILTMAIYHFEYSQT